MEQRAKEQMEPINEVKDLIDQNLEKVEARLDSTVESAKVAVHEIRNESQQALERTLDRFGDVWERAQSRLEAQVGRHPWAVLGGLLLIG